MKKKSKYADMPLQTISRKVWSSLIDGLLLLVVGVILTLTVGFRILKGNEKFAKYNTQCFDNIEEMYKIQDDAKLQKITSNNSRKVLGAADYFKEYIIKQIRLSYIVFEEDFKEEGINLEINENNYSTLENDELAYYFIVYKTEKNINVNDFEGLTPLTYFKKEIFFKNINNKYYLDVENNLPVIKSETAIKLYKHYIEEENNVDLYREFSDAVLKIRNIGLNDLFSYNVFKEHYDKYLEAYQMMAKYENIVLLIMHLIAFLIVIGIPNIICKNGISAGKLLTRTRFIHYNNSSIGVIRRSCVTLLSYLAYLALIILISLFTFGFENLAIPIFMIRNLSVSFIQILLFGVAFIIANFLIMCITSAHHSLIDFISRTKQIDVTYYIEEIK